MILKKFKICSVIIILILTSCSHTKVITSKTENKMDLKNPMDYTGFWTAMRCGLPELVSLYSAEPDKLAFADCLLKIKEGKHSEAEAIARKILRESKNDTILDYSKFLLSKLLIYQSKWSEYYNLNRDTADTEANQIKHLLYPAFIGLHSSDTFTKDIDTISIRLKKGSILVPVIINGKEFEFLFDTGTQMSTIGSDVASSTGLKILFTHPSALLGSMGHTSEVSSALADNFSVGNFTSINSPCFITASSNLKSKFWFYTFMSFDGCIGWNIIRNLDVEIDYKNEKMIIRKPTKREITRRNLFWFSDPIVKLKSESGIDLLFFLDLGANKSSFYDFLLMKIKPENIKEDNRTYYGIGGSLNRDLKVIPKIRFYLDDYTLDYENLYLGYETTNDFIKLDGVLGNDFGKEGILRIDATNGIMEYK